MVRLHSDIDQQAYLLTIALKLAPLNAYRDGWGRVFFTHPGGVGRPVAGRDLPDRVMAVVERPFPRVQEYLTETVVAVFDQVLHAESDFLEQHPLPAGEAYDDATLTPLGQELMAIGKRYDGFNRTALDMATNPPVPPNQSMAEHMVELVFWFGV